MAHRPQGADSSGLAQDIEKLSLGAAGQARNAEDAASVAERASARGEGTSEISARLPSHLRPESPSTTGAQGPPRKTQRAYPLAYIQHDARYSSHGQQQHRTNESQAGQHDVPSQLNPNASTFQPAEVRTRPSRPLESVCAARWSHMDHAPKWRRNGDEPATVSENGGDRGSSTLTSVDDDVCTPSPPNDPPMPATGYKEPVPGKTPKPRTRRRKKGPAPKAAAPVSADAELTLPIRAPPATSTPPEPPEQERLMLIERPRPSEAYLSRAHEAPSLRAQPRPLLVVLDLNGTLVHREQRGGSFFVARPRVREFLRDLLARHKVLVWSSARPTNVRRMCKQLFSRAQRDELVGVWSRDDLRLEKEHYYQKIQVYKRLSWVWDNDAIASSCVGANDPWSQQNTVLIDDSTEKAASEPLNLIRIDEFEGKGDLRQADVLGQVARYLNTLRSQNNVSAYIRTTPFVYDSTAEAYNWEPPVTDVPSDIKEAGGYVSG